MTKKTELHDGERWVDVTGDVADVTVARGRQSEAEPGSAAMTLDNGKGKPEPTLLSLGGMSADAALAALIEMRATAPSVVVFAELAPPTDQVVVGDHAYNGQQVGSAWHFAPSALEMACRVAGWSTVEHLEPGKLRLS